MLPQAIAKRVNLWDSVCPKAQIGRERGTMNNYKHSDLPTKLSTHTQIKDHTFAFIIRTQCEPWLPLAGWQRPPGAIGPRYGWPSADSRQLLCPQPGALPQPGQPSKIPISSHYFPQEVGLPETDTLGSRRWAQSPSSTRTTWIVTQPSITSISHAHSCPTPCPVPV